MSESIRVGVIGLGAMGAPMAGHISNAGLLAVVWNRTASKARALAMDSGAPVLPMFYVKKDDDTYEFIIEKELSLVSTGNRRKDMEENTRRFHKVIEKYIKEYPTQWVWMHNRWKTTPEMVEAKKRKKNKS